MNNGCVYLRDQDHAYGRVSLAQVMEWIRSGQLSSSAEVSADSQQWMPIAQLAKQPHESQADATEQAQGAKNSDPTRPELRRILRRIQGCVRGLSKKFTTLVCFIFCATSLLAFTLSYMITASFHNSILICAGVALIPGVMTGMALAHLAGNFVLAKYTGLTPLERRCLALHLPWCRTPKYWPSYLRRWIYNGDWLIECRQFQLLPYARAFITGKTPGSIEEELQIWNELMARTRKSVTPDLEVGQSIRELACVTRLPDWTREIDPGMSLDQLQKTLGRIGHDWAVNLLRRAGSRMPDLQQLDPERDLNRVTFEFHHCEMSDDRSGLLVILRPHEVLSHPSGEDNGPTEPQSSAA